MRNLARAVSKIRRTIEPLFVLSDRAVIRRGRREASPMPRDGCTCASCCTHPGHTFAHIMLPFMPRTCAEQLHFKITDFAARFVRKHARDKSPYLRASPSPTRIQNFSITLPCTSRLHWQHQFYLARPIDSSHPPFYKKKSMAPKRAERFEL